MKKTSIILLLSVIAFLNATYLTGKAYDLIPGKTFCDINSIWSCGNVVQHPAAQIFGIPFPAIAMVVYPVLFVLTRLIAGAMAAKKPYKTLARRLMGLSIAGICFNSYIIYQETFTIKAFCPLCLLCTVIIISIAIISGQIYRRAKA